MEPIVTRIHDSFSHVNEQLRLTTSLWRKRWNEDVRGASMVTTAVTLPLLIMLMLGIFSLFRTMMVKWVFDRGVREAAHFISEESMFWEGRFERGMGVYDEVAQLDLGPPPVDFYDIQARRIIVSRLRDVIQDDEVFKAVTATLQITVTEPLLSQLAGVNGITVTEPITQGMDLDEICKRPRKYDKNTLEKKLWRHHENIRFRVFASMDMPLAWTPKIPFTEQYTITMGFKNRAMGYVDCTRWSGQREANGIDKTRLYGREGPSLNYRELATPWYPSATIPPSPTPTITPIPTATMVQP